MIEWNFEGDMGERLGVRFENTSDGSVQIETKAPGSEAKRLRVKSPAVTDFKQAKALMRKLFILGFRDGNEKVKAALKALLGPTIHRVKDSSFYTTWD